MSDRVLGLTNQHGTDAPTQALSHGAGRSLAVPTSYLYSTCFTGCLSVTRNLRTCGQMAFDSRPWKSW